MLAANKEKLNKLILETVFIVLILIIGSIIGEIIFNLGQELGTFLRGIYKIVVC